MQKVNIAPEVGNKGANAIDPKKLPKKPRSKPMVIVKDIMSRPLCDYLESCIRFKVPEGGIHKPMLWRNRENWGVIYKVLPKVTAKKMLKTKSLKYLALQIRWKYRRGNLMPEAGFEDLAKSLDMNETTQLKEILAEEITKVNSAAETK